MKDLLDALKWTLQINVEGMSLWMHRGDHIDVLFPDDKLGVSWKHHFVTLHPMTPESDAPMAMLPQAMPTGLPLQGVTLDFRRLRTLPAARQTQTPHGMLPMPVEAGSLATKADAVITGEGLVAGLRLPLGVVSSLGHEKGPFAFNGDETLYLGFGVKWVGALIGRHDVVADVITYGSTATYEFELFTDRASFVDRELTIKSLSFDDRITMGGGMAYGERLTEVASQGYIACANKQPLADVPVFHGNRPGTVSVRARPSKPCPAGWGI